MNGSMIEFKGRTIIRPSIFIRAHPFFPLFLCSIAVALLCVFV
jgi:hypothetical protein